MHVVSILITEHRYFFFCFKVSVFPLFSLLFLRGINVFGLMFSKTKHRLPMAKEKIFSRSSYIRKGILSNYARLNLSGSVNVGRD